MIFWKMIRSFRIDHKVLFGRTPQIHMFFNNDGTIKEFHNKYGYGQCMGY